MWSYQSRKWRHHKPRLYRTLRQFVCSSSMATDHKSNPTNYNKNNKKRKNYLPQYKPVKRGSYPLRAGAEGFFITCDGGREHQAANEAISVIESFYEELVEDAESIVEHTELYKKASNKITKFTYSDSSDSDNDDEDNAKDSSEDDANVKSNLEMEEDKNGDSTDDGDGDDDDDDDDGDRTDDDESRLDNKDVPLEKQPQTENEEPENLDIIEAEALEPPEKRQCTDAVPLEKQTQTEKEKPENQDAKEEEAEALEPPEKRQCTDAEAPNSRSLSKKVERKSVDKLIEAELAELGDKSKRRFIKLDTGCNGVIFIQMRKKEEDPSPKDIVLHMMTSLAKSKKHVSRFLLRVLPVEVTCYTSDDEIRRAIKPVIEKYFPIETEKPHKFSVLYDARANTGINRTKVIDAVAKCVPSVHKVDLANPDISIMVQIVKTVCLIGVVEKYKEFSKYNLRQLSCPSKEQ